MCVCFVFTCLFACILYTGNVGDHWSFSFTYFQYSVVIQCSSLVLTFNLPVNRVVANSANVARMRRAYTKIYVPHGTRRRRGYKHVMYVAENIAVFGLRTVLLRLVSSGSAMYPWSGIDCRETIMGVST